MSWSVGFNETLQRDIGYGVPAICDHPDCNEKIDRGFDFVCGEPPYGEGGCGLHFCHKHREAHFPVDEDGEELEPVDGLLCERCRNNQPPFEMKPDTAKWINHKMSDPSWAEWRKEQGFEKADTPDTTRETPKEEGNGIL